MGKDLLKKEDSKGSLERLKKRERYFLEIATTTENPREATDIVRACFDQSVIGRVDPTNESEFQEVVNAIATFRMQLGQYDDVDSTTLAVESKFVVDNFPECSLMDLKLAFTLLIQQRLNIKLSYVRFSVLFVGQVLKAYDDYKKEILRELKSKSDKNILLAPKPTARQRVQSMRECITMCYDHLRAGGIEYFFNGMVFDFLVKTRRLILNEGFVQSAIDYAGGKYLKRIGHDVDYVRKVINVTPDLKKEKESLIRRYKIEFYLTQYFKEIDLKKLLSSITPDQWEENNENDS